MSLVNVAWSRSLAWSAPNLTLEDQMHMPMFGKTPVELGMDREAKTFLKIVRSDKLYQRLFRNAFPGVQNPFTVTNVVKAIASFERSIVSARSDWDEDWQQVQRTSSAHRAPPRTSIAAQRGESLFFSEKLACAKCHGGTNFDGSFSSAAQRESGAVFHNNGMPAGDPGLSEYTQAVQDVGKFKAPTMRNIELTAPYMHDGSLATLEAVVDHYAAGGSHTPTQSPLVRGFVLSERDRGDLVAFLRSLTDHPVTVDPRFSDPWKRAGVSGSQRSPQ